MAKNRFKKKSEYDELEKQPSLTARSGTSAVSANSGAGATAGGGGRKRNLDQSRQQYRSSRSTNNSNSTNSNISDIQVKLLYGLIIVVVSIVAYFAYLGYLETRIYTPINEPKVSVKTGLDIPERFWGSYRSGVYFGMKHRSPRALLTGLMWLIPSQIKPRNPGLRHLCQQDDNLKKYGWIAHDGVNFGVQEILDNQIKLTTSFVKRQGGVNGGDWTARIEVNPKSQNSNNSKNEVVLLFYVARENGVFGNLDPEIVDNDLNAIHGNTDELGNFIIRFLSGKGVLHSSHLITSVNSMNDLSYTVLNNMISQRKNGKILYYLDDSEENRPTSNPNFIVYHVHVKGPFILDVVYESESFFDRLGMLVGDSFTSALDTHRENFHKKFQKIFHLEPEFNSSSIQFAEAAMSNLIGGIGYFYGTSRVQSMYNSAPVSYWPSSLYTGVPSRSFFPRGFLWDEGFQLLLTNKWEPEISLDIISHWLDLMNIEGWIPREQILGEESVVRVPEEFIVQKNDVANPPTIFMALLDLMQRHGDWLIDNHRSTLFRMWPRLTSWYQWLNRTQSGEIATTYRWRGRNETTNRELNPKTLASGLDDYPRASHPSNEERHLDLRCWMAMASKAMSEIAILLGYDQTKYFETWEMLSNKEQLDYLHWSTDLKAYADFGQHSRNVILKDTIIRAPPNSEHVQKSKVRVTLEAPKLDYINMFGYVNLFPMLLQILPSDSNNLKLTLSHLENRNLLWTSYGLRSLAANSPLYNVGNTEHDPPYWRGPIWININFLALKSLKHYSKTSHGPTRELAQRTYEKLRSNIIENMIKEYFKTGYIWEQYNDQNGNGKGCRPFTGWSSLIVLIMSEEY